MQSAEWKSVKDALPGNMQPVLLNLGCFSGYTYALGWRRDDKWDIPEATIPQDDYQDMITNWMPIPKPPDK